LYTSVPKEEKKMETKREVSPTKLHQKKDKTSTLQKANMFDSNLSNSLMEQRKILYSKNYELDSRAWGLKNFGIQPYLKEQLS